MVQSLEFVASTVAVVYNPQFEPKSPVSAQAIGQFLQRPTVNLSPDGSVVITSHRDQVEVVLSANKVDFRDVSGRDERVYEKIPGVLHELCLLLSDDPPKSFGINFIVSVPKENPSAWIAQKFLTKDLNSFIQAPLESDTVSVIYKQSDKRVTVRFEPSPESTVIVNFNASEEVTKLPGQEEMATDIKFQQRALLDFLAALEI